MWHWGCTLWCLMFVGTQEGVSPSRGKAGTRGPGAWVPLLRATPRGPRRSSPGSQPLLPGCCPRCWPGRAWRVYDNLGSQAPAPAPGSSSPGLLAGSWGCPPEPLTTVLSLRGSRAFRLQYKQERHWKSALKRFLQRWGIRGEVGTEMQMRVPSSHPWPSLWPVPSRASVLTSR